MSWLVVLTELGIGVALIFGIATRYASLFTFVYLIIATAIAHRYWEAQPAAVATQYAQFCKNWRSWAALCCSTCLGPDGSHSTLGCDGAES
jgi:uncharacterized membrane protein YphA (DoxX/SURF4 family)